MRSALAVVRAADPRDQQPAASQAADRLLRRGTKPPFGTRPHTHPIPYEYGPDVQFRLDVVGDGPQIVEVVEARVCPSCGTDWTKPGAYRLGTDGAGAQQRSAIERRVGRADSCWGGSNYSQ